MQRKIMWLLIVLALPVLPARAENAMDYYTLGLKNTLNVNKIKYFSKALELDPRLAEAYEQRAMIYFYQEKFDRVIEDYLAYVRIAPPRAEAYRMLGMGYLKNGDYDQAVDRFNRAIEMEPGMFSAYANRAEAYRLSGKFEEALRDATLCIRESHDGRIQSDAYRTRARVFREMGRTDLANADIRATWEVDPRFPLWSRYFLKSASPEEMSKAAPFILLGIVIVLVFGLKLKPPEKDD